VGRTNRSEALPYDTLRDCRCRPPSHLGRSGKNAQEPYRGYSWIVRLGLPITVALTAALGCGSSESGSLFGHGPGELDRDASILSDASSASAGGAGGGAGGNSSGSGGRTSSGIGGLSAGSGGTSSGGSSGSGTGGGSKGGASSGGGNGAGGTCQPQKWCRDRDGDGHGNPNESQLACTSPGGEWKAACDDCHDGNASVHPGADCHDGAYALADGTLSFDYDCDGSESECGTFVKARAAGCGVVGPLNCAGGGYLPNPNRTATGQQNAYCGSTSYRNCVSVGLPCVAQTATKTVVVCH
jgi:hypothetical protein